jgi:hypothetical protein
MAHNVVELEDLLLIGVRYVGSSVDPVVEVRIEAVGRGFEVVRVIGGEYRLGTGLLL